MSQTLELPEEVAELLAAEAARRGQEPSEYVRTLVEESVQSRSATDRDRKAPPERVIVAGMLDQLTVSRRTFRLLLPTGERLRGVLPPGDPEQFAPLVGKKVVVDGIAHFRRSRAVARLVASHIQLASEKDVIWDRVPRPRPRTLADLEPDPPITGAEWMKRVFGQWPGDETTEELLAALKAMD
jgi:hypothetical protein